MTTAKQIFDLLKTAHTQDVVDEDNEEKRVFYFPDGSRLLFQFTEDNAIAYWNIDKAVVE